MATPASPSSTSELLTFTAQIVAAHIAANTVLADALPALILAVHDALAHPGTPSHDMQLQEPAVPIKHSLQPDYLICLEDGAKLKVLTRYIQRFGLTPKAYRAKWGLPRDYPMVASTYSARRSALAKQLGLGAALRKAAPVPPADLERKPDLPDELTAQVQGEAQHTVASVFANFPGGVLEQPAPAANDAEKSGRKRFAQQFMRDGRRRA